MASVKLILRKNKVLADNSCPIIIQILKDGSKAIHSIGVSIFEKDWNHDTNLPKNARLALLCQRKMVKAQEIMVDAIEFHWSARKVADILSGKESRKTLFIEFAHQYIQELQNNGQEGNAYSYRNPVKQFADFLQKDIPIQNLTYNTLTKFVQFKADLKPSTRITYLSKLRAIYNEAAERDLFVKKTNPFKKSLFAGNTKTEHRNFTTEQISTILQYKLQHMPRENDYNKQLAHDLYSFGYYMRGMDLIDIALIPTKAINTKSTHYRYTRKKIQSKSVKEMMIWIPPQARTIIDKYYNKENRYIFPLVSDESIEINKAYRSYTAKLHTINKYLKRIGTELELPIPLTTKTNRHTFASIAKERKIPFLYIQELLGHSLHSVTDIYRDVISQAQLDEYHRNIIDHVTLNIDKQMLKNV